MSRVHAPNTPPMNDLWNDIRFFIGGSPDSGCRARGIGRAAEIALAGGCRRLCPGCNCTPSAKMQWEEGRIVGRIGLTKSVVRRDRGELCRLSSGDLIPVTRARGITRKVVSPSSRWRKEIDREGEGEKEIYSFRSWIVRGLSVLWLPDLPIYHRDEKTIGTVINYISRAYV